MAKQPVVVIVIIFGASFTLLITVFIMEKWRDLNDAPLLRFAHIREASYGVLRGLDEGPLRLDD